MPVTGAGTVAEWFLWKSETDGRSITNLKVQKLVYYAQAWHLALVIEPLFQDEIEAWVHGPVVPDLYFKYRSYGWNPIATIPADSPFTDAEADIVDHLEDVWSVYGGYDARYLEALTHKEPPWQIAREGIDDRDRSSAVITHESMRQYYQSVLKRDLGGE